MSLSAVKRKVKDEEGFNLDDVLAGATAPKVSKSSKSNVPVLTVSKDLQAKAARIREVKNQLDSLESQYETLAAELVEGASPLRESLCVKQGYASAVRLPDGKGLSIGISWSDKYSKISAENEKALRSIAGDKFDGFFKADMVVTVRDISEESLKEIVKAVGPERFAQFFTVEKTFKPTTRFTQEAFTVFTPEQRRKFMETGVKQNKPSVKVN